MSMLKIKIKFLPSRDADTDNPFKIRCLFQVLRPVLTQGVHADLFFFGLFLKALKECIHDFFDVLCSGKIQNCAENQASPEQIFRVT